MSVELDSGPRVDAALSALAHRDRRRLLHDLRRESTLSLHDAAAVVANGCGRDLGRLQLELQHVHLPKLVDRGYVDHDSERDVVCRGPNFTEVEPLLRLMADHADELPDGWL